MNEYVLWSYAIAFVGVFLPLSTLYVALRYYLAGKIPNDGHTVHRGERSPTDDFM